MKTLTLLTLCAVLSGCGVVRRLPPVKASEVHTVTSVMGVKVSADGYTISHTPTTLKAADAKFTVAFPGFYHETSVKDFEQKLPKEDIK